MNIKRVTLAGAQTSVSFPNKCGKWLVKNLSMNDLFVSFDENAETDKTVKIAAGMGQVIVDNEFMSENQLFRHDTIYLNGTGEAEVQQLCFA